MRWRSEKRDTHKMVAYTGFTGPLNKLGSTLGVEDLISWFGRQKGERLWTFKFHSFLFS